MYATNYQKEPAAALPRHLLHALLLGLALLRLQRERAEGLGLLEEQLVRLDGLLLLSDGLRAGARVPAGVATCRNLELQTT